MLNIVGCNLQHPPQTWIFQSKRILYKINRCASPFCECGLDYALAKHFFLFCPRYTAQRNLLFTSAARILGETWSSSSDARKINFFLFGVKSVNYDINCTLIIRNFDIPLSAGFLFFKSLTPVTANLDLTSFIAI